MVAHSLVYGYGRQLSLSRITCIHLVGTRVPVAVHTIVQIKQNLIIFVILTNNANTFEWAWCYPCNGINSRLALVLPVGGPPTLYRFEKPLLSPIE